MPDNFDDSGILEYDENTESYVPGEEIDDPNWDKYNTTGSALDDDHQFREAVAFANSVSNEQNESIRSSEIIKEIHYYLGRADYRMLKLIHAILEADCIFDDDYHERIFPTKKETPTNIKEIQNLPAVPAKEVEEQKPALSLKQAVLDRKAKQDAINKKFDIPEVFDKKQ